MNKERIEELKAIAENILAEEIAVLRSMTERHMPDVIINKHMRDVKTWEDMITLINEYSDSLVHVEEIDCSMANPDTPDMVNQPYHYTTGQYEVVDVIKDWLTEEEFRGYIKGNLIKYISRERYKNGNEDMKKAEFYLHYYNSDGEKGVK